MVLLVLTVGFSEGGEAGSHDQWIIAKRRMTKIKIIVSAPIIYYFSGLFGDCPNIYMQYNIFISSHSLFY